MSTIKSLLNEAIELFEQALTKEDITNMQRSVIYRHLIKAYNEQERLAEVRVLKQYYFGKGIESLSDALFYGLDNQKAEWIKDIVQRGSGIMARLNLMFGQKESKDRSYYMEKILVKVNKANVDLVMRLSWYISTAGHKSAIMFHNSKRYKEAFTAIQRAL